MAAHGGAPPPRSRVVLLFDCNLDVAEMQRRLSPEQIAAVLKGIGRVLAAGAENPKEDAP